MWKNLTPNRFLLISFLCLSAYVVANRNWINTRYPLQMDANGYYIYLPALFIYNDLDRLSFVDKMPDQFDRKYFLYPGSQGGYMTKYTPGMAILELPFFLAAHSIASILGFEANGYSPPYRLAVAISTLFYTFLGLWFLAKLLGRYFSQKTILWTIGLTLFATNLLFYSAIQAGITHNFVFFALVIALYFGDRWKHTWRWQDFALSCIGAGLAALIRPTEILIAAIPFGILFHVFRSSASISLFWQQHKSALLSGLLGFCALLFPIFLYWKFATGSWIAYTYEDEGFYFDRPWQIWLGLFGFRKGWFIYTPLLFLAIWGFFFMLKDVRFRHFTSTFIWYLPLNVYIVLSWYGWWYGGCFGLRALVPALGLMAVPLAVLFEKLNKNKFQFLGLQILAILFTILNLFQSFQYQRQILHMDSMTWKAYFFIFGKWRLTEEEKAYRNTLLDYANYSERGKKLSEYFEEEKK